MSLAISAVQLGRFRVAASLFISDLSILTCVLCPNAWRNSVCLIPDENLQTLRVVQEFGIYCLREFLIVDAATQFIWNIDHLLPWQLQVQMNLFMQMNLVRPRHAIKYCTWNKRIVYAWHTSFSKSLDSVNIVLCSRYQRWFCGSLVPVVQWLRYLYYKVAGHLIMSWSFFEFSVSSIKTSLDILQINIVFKFKTTRFYAWWFRRRTVRLCYHYYTI
jgi:hypothetical protein